ncbi:MAG: Sec-independent protein translocase protein TatB [Pseudomonadota bacterium]
MFDIGFWEVIFIMVITLLVVGPERLPKVARTAGLWVGKIRGFVVSVKAEIDQELATEELKRSLQKQASIPELDELIDEASGKVLSDNLSTGEPATRKLTDTESGEAADDKQAR